MSKNKVEQQANDKASGFQVYKRLLTYAFKYRYFFFLAIVGMVITSLADISFVAMLKQIIDKGFVDKDSSFVKTIPMLIILVFFVRGVGVFLDNYFLTMVARKTIFKLRADLFDKALKLPTAYYDNTSSSALVSKIIYDVEQVASACTNAINVFVKDMVLVIGLMTWLMILSFKLTLILLVILPIIGFVIRKTSLRFRKASHSIQDSIKELLDVSKETVSGHKIVKTFGSHVYERGRFSVANGKNFRYALKKATISAVNVSIILLLIGAAISIILFMAMNEAEHNAITAGAFISYLTTIMMLMSPIKRLAKINEILQAGIAGAQSIFETLDQTPEINTGKKVIKDVKGRIQFDQVSFYYQNIEDEEADAQTRDIEDKVNSSTIQPKAKVIKDFNLDIAPGQSIALVGASGSGKSTIVSLLLRFYDVTSGQIKLDDCAITELELDGLRESMSMVSQEVVLFNDTIRNNIVYGNQKYDEDKLQRVCDGAYVSEFVDQLPLGLDTIVGESGVRLSGGQRQRIAIARAFYKDSPILILDEATSALDTQSEIYVQKAIEALMKNRTSIIIAHRLSTVRDVDRIVVMNKGKIVESGSHEQLLSDSNGYFYRYYHAQIKKESNDNESLDLD